MLHAEWLYLAIGLDVLAIVAAVRWRSERDEARRSARAVTAEAVRLLRAAPEAARAAGEAALADRPAVLPFPASRVRGPVGGPVPAGWRADAGHVPGGRA